MELWVSFLCPDQMQMRVAQELELFGLKEFAADPSDHVDERGEEQKEVARRSIKPGAG